MYYTGGRTLSRVLTTVSELLSKDRVLGFEFVQPVLEFAHFREQSRDILVDSVGRHHWQTRRFRSRGQRLIGQSRKERVSYGLSSRFF